MSPTIGCVVLSTGRRPGDLSLALGSVLRQRGVEVELVVVGNAWEPAGLPPGVRAVGLPEDVGIPGGRNTGVPAVGGELLAFIDDDASLAEDDAFARVAAEFASDPRLGLVQLRVDSRSGGALSRDWVPRLRVGDRTRSSDVTVVWEGAVVIRRAVFEKIGGWPADFRYVHEGVDLAWRVMDAGYRVRYLGDVAALHPSLQARPHPYASYYRARNRVWLARRHLPMALGVLYVAGFVLRTLPRLHTAREVREAARGYREGLRRPCGPRRPLRCRTLWRMTVAGRPPII